MVLKQACFVCLFVLLPGGEATAKSLWAVMRRTVGKGLLDDLTDRVVSWKLLDEAWPATGELARCVCRLDKTGRPFVMTGGEDTFLSLTRKPSEDCDTMGGRIAKRGEVGNDEETEVERLGWWFRENG